MQNTKAVLESIVVLRNGTLKERSHNYKNNLHHPLPSILKRLWFEGISSDIEKYNRDPIVSSEVSSKHKHRMNTMNDQWDSSLKWIVNFSGNDWKEKRHRYTSREEKACKKTCINDPSIDEPERKDFSDLFWSGLSFLTGCSYIHAVSMYASKVWFWHDSIVFLFQVVSCTLWLGFIKLVFQYLGEY